MGSKSVCPFQSYFVFSFCKELKTRLNLAFLLPTVFFSWRYQGLNSRYFFFTCLEACLVKSYHSGSQMAPFSLCPFIVEWERSHFTSFPLKKALNSPCPRASGPNIIIWISGLVGFCLRWKSFPYMLSHLDRINNAILSCVL